MAKTKAQKATTVPEQKSNEPAAIPELTSAIGVDFAATRVNGSSLGEDYIAFPKETASPKQFPPQMEKGDSIFTFQEGDVIINVLPKKIKRLVSGFGYSAFWGGSSEIEEPDNRYRQPFRLLGVRNNLIYLRTIRGEGINGSAFLYKVPVDELENGWKIFDIPENLTETEAAGVPD